MSARGNTAMLNGYEQTLLSRFLQDEKAIGKYERVGTEHFPSPVHREIFAAILSLHVDGRDSNYLAVQDYLRGRGRLAAIGEHTVLNLATDSRIAVAAMDDSVCDYAAAELMDAWREREAAQIGKDLAAGKITAAQAHDKLDQQVVATTSNAFFDAGRNLYWILNQRGGWIALNETQFKRILKDRNVSPVVPKGSYVSPLDKRLIEIQQTCDVHYAGALAGYAAGVYEAGERRILVTESPRIIEPKPGEWSTLKAFIDGLLHDPEFCQKPYLYGWLKVAYEALRVGKLRPGQLLAIAGVHDCGKSLLQNLITLILGGRAAKPYQFMSGLTPFNSDLFEAEHLMIEDEQASYDIRSRRNFGAQLKNITATEWQRCHAKNRAAIILAPFWRVSMSVNDEPENLMVLPPIDDSIEDKIILLRAAKNLMPMPTATNDQRAAFWQKLVGELPALLDDLTQWEIPRELLSERFGITHFHHPEILEAIDCLAPEFRLLRLIDEDDELFGGYEQESTWEGSAEQLERHLCRDKSECRHEARRLFTYNTACGVFLARLAKKYPVRFKNTRVGDTRTWTIKIR